MAISLAELNNKRVHLLGISGAGQNALAEMLLDAGCQVSGSDLKLSDSAFALKARGVTLFQNQIAANITDQELLVKTSAAPENNPELVEARQRGIEVLSNAQMVGMLINEGHKRCLAIAGSHGKTSTTNLVAGLLSKAGQDPTYYIGGVSRDLNRAGALGKGEYSVVEADEYARRFLEYLPEAAIITNIEPDHLDYYGTYDKLVDAFREFAGRARRLFFCADSPEGRAMAEEFKLKQSSGAFTYGIDGLADWHATNIEVNEQGGHDFTLWQSGHMVGRVSLGLPGIHNVRNAVGALALCITVAPQVRPATFCQLAGEFKGTARRFDVMGDKDGITLVDDYAHHPTEIAATLSAAKARFKGRRLIALFQPHTYSRTKAMLEEFAQAFNDADVVALMEIFPSRETDTLGVSSADILSRMQHSGKLAQVLTHDTAATTLRGLLQPGDVLLALGAGDVNKVLSQI